MGMGPGGFRGPMMGGPGDDFMGMGGGMGGMSGGMGGRGGMMGGRGGGMNRGMNRGGRGGGSVKDRLGDKDTVINPVFDSLYEPEFGTDNQKSAFEKAREKLNSRGSSQPRGRGFGGPGMGFRGANRGGGGPGVGAGPGSYRGARGGGPPRKTWSN